VRSGVSGYAQGSRIHCLPGLSDTLLLFGMFKERASLRAKYHMQFSEGRDGSRGRVDYKARLGSRYKALSLEERVIDDVVVILSLTSMDQLINIPNAETLFKLLIILLVSTSSLSVHCAPDNGMTCYITPSCLNTVLRYAVLVSSIKEWAFVVDVRLRPITLNLYHEFTGVDLRCTNR
jgi:hypothetical protein